MNKVYIEKAVLNCLSSVWILKLLSEESLDVEVVDTLYVDGLVIPNTGFESIFYIEVPWVTFERKHDIFFLNLVGKDKNVHVAFKTRRIGKYTNFKNIFNHITKG